jgi:hypothetical protein
MQRWRHCPHLGKHQWPPKPPILAKANGHQGIVALFEGQESVFESPGASSKSSVPPPPLADRITRLAGELGAALDSKLNFKAQITILEKAAYGIERDGKLAHRLNSLEDELGLL